MGRGPWKLTVRRTGAVERSRHATLDDALLAAEGALSASPRLPGRRAFVRDIPAGGRVAGRAEVRGPGPPWSAARGGIDVRGDGSAEAYRGLVRKTLVGQRPGEQPFDALRRALAEPAA